MNISGIRSRFSTPTPCSPVSTPPTFTQSRRMSAPKSLRPLELARHVGVVEDQRVQIAVAGMKHVGDAQPILFRQLAHAGEHARQLLARDGAVHAVIVGRDAADRREGRLAAGPERQPLLLPIVEMRQVVEPFLQRDRLDQADQVVDLDARPVELDDQQRLDIRADSRRGRNPRPRGSPAGPSSPCRPG